MASTIIKKDVNFMETMDLGADKAMQISERTGKGGQLVTSAKITIRKADGSGTEVIRVDDEAAVMTYGRVATLTALHEKAGIALCYELSVIRDKKLYVQFGGIQSFAEWCERVTGLSGKTGDTYARIGARLVDCVEKDGKQSYILKYGLQDYSGFLTVGHLLELLKLAPKEGEESAEYDIPSILIDAGFSMYLSTKNLRDAIKKALGEVKVEAEQSEAEQTEAEQSEAEQTEAEQTEAEQSEAEQTEAEQAEQSEVERLRLDFNNARQALNSVSDTVQKYLTDDQFEIFREVLVRLSNITF